MDCGPNMKRLQTLLSSPLFVGGGVLALVAAVFGQVVGFEFLPFWDDDTNIHRNPLYAPLSWGSVAMFWKAPFQQLYIPVTYTVWGALVALSRVFAGTSISFGPITAGFFHGTNLLIHLLSTAMVFLILRRLLSARYPGGGVTGMRILWASAAGSLLFALHPVQVETVAWVSGLRDLLGGAFALAATAVFLSWLVRGARCPRTYALATLFLLLALGSKPGAVVTPVLALLCGIWILRAGHLFPDSGKARRLPLPPLRPLLWLIPWFVIALLEVVMTSKAQPAAELAQSLVPAWARPLVACDAIAFYFGKLLWPFSLCADYGRSPNSAMDAGLLYWTWPVPLGVAACVLLIRKLRPYFLPYALFVAGVLPTLGLIPFNFQIVSTVSDRYLYLAMLGPAAAFALLLCRLSARTAAATAALLIPAWAVLSFLQLPEWASGRRFFPATLSRNPASWKSRHNYACTLDAQGKLQEALAEFHEAIRLRPSNAEAHNDMALTLLRMGRRDEAALSFQQSLQVRPTAGAARNLAAVLLMSGEPVKAAQIYRLAMEIDPGDLANQRALAWLLATHPDNRVRNGREAVLLAEQIVSATNGQVPLFLLTLSAAYAEAGDFDRALDVAQRAAQGYQRSGEPKMASMIQAQILPGLRNRLPMRDSPEAPRPM